MRTNSNKINDSLISSNKSLTNFDKKVRIFYTNQDFVDFTLYQSSEYETFFLKDVKSFAKLKETLSNEFFSFISEFTSDNYLSFLQIKDNNDFANDLKFECPNLDPIANIDGNTDYSFLSDIDSSILSLQNEENLLTNKNFNNFLDDGSSKYDQIFPKITPNLISDAHKDSNSPKNKLRFVSERFEIFDSPDKNLSNNQIKKNVKEIKIVNLDKFESNPDGTSLFKKDKQSNKIDNSEKNIIYLNKDKNPDNVGETCRWKVKLAKTNILYEKWEKEIIVTLETEVPEMPKEKLNRPSSIELRKQLTNHNKEIERLNTELIKLQIERKNPIQKNQKSQKERQEEGQGERQQILTDLYNQIKKLDEEISDLMQQKNLIENDQDKASKEKWNIIKNLTSKKKYTSNDCNKRLDDLHILLQNKFITLDEEKVFIEEQNELKRCSHFIIQKEAKEKYIKEVTEEKKVLARKIRNKQQQIKEISPQIDKVKNKDLNEPVEDVERKYYTRTHSITLQINNIRNDILKHEEIKTTEKADFEKAYQNWTDQHELELKIDWIKNKIAHLIKKKKEEMYQGKLEPQETQMQFKTEFNDKKFLKSRQQSDICKNLMYLLESYNSTEYITYKIEDICVDRKAESIKQEEKKADKLLLARMADNFDNDKVQKNDQDFKKNDTNDELIACENFKQDDRKFATISFYDGSVYEGFQQNNLRDGFGSSVERNGQIYKGEYKNNQRHGKGKLSKNGKTSYEGDWINNHKEGFGTLRHQSSLYTGEFKKDKKNGHGKKISQGKKAEKNWTYEGQWENDNKNGFGTEILKSDRIYRGEWINNQRHGFGTEVDLKGNSYEGYWHFDMKHGKGRQMMANYDQYEGMFNSNKKEGYGEYLFNIGCIFKGNWKNDMFEGKGEFIDPNNYRYEGNFDKGRKHGYGILIYANGDEYRGEFRNDEKCG